MFPRFIRPIHHSSRRSYSLFSKPPGGRFFNSSKPPKVVQPAIECPRPPSAPILFTPSPPRTLPTRISPLRFLPPAHSQSHTATRHRFHNHSLGICRRPSYVRGPT